MIFEGQVPSKRNPNTNSSFDWLRGVKLADSYSPTGKNASERWSLDIAKLVESVLLSVYDVPATARSPWSLSAYLSPWYHRF